MPLPPLNPNLIRNVATEMTAKNKEAARGLPDSKGGETPKQLQTHRADIFSYFTDPNGGTELLYSAESWVTIKMVLNDEGPVAIGTSGEISPISSGAGRLLIQNVEYSCDCPKGTRIFIASDSRNRVGVTIQPIPWLEQIDHDTIESLSNVRKSVLQVGVAIVNALRGAGRAVSSSGKTVDQLPEAPGDRRMIPRLTGVGSARKIR